MWERPLIAHLQCCEAMYFVLLKDLKTLTDPPQVKERTQGACSYSLTAIPEKRVKVLLKWVVFLFCLVKTWCTDLSKNCVVWVYRLTLCSASEWYYYGALILNAVCAIHAHLNHISNFPRETSPAEQGVSKYLVCAHTLVALMYCTNTTVCQFSQAAPASRAGKNCEMRNMSY